MIIQLMTYPCTKCGLCCKQLGAVLDNKHLLDMKKQVLLDSFPYKVDSNGACSMLGDDGLCTVYDHRPIICNIEHMITLYKLDQSEYYKTCADSCNILIKKTGLSKEYLVEIPEKLT